VRRVVEDSRAVYKSPFFQLKFEKQNNRTKHPVKVRYVMFPDSSIHRIISDKKFRPEINLALAIDYLLRYLMKQTLQLLTVVLRPKFAENYFGFGSESTPV